MPPRINQGQSSFSVNQESQQVVCPLKNQDGTNCRKRCLGEKRFRSMQEHIRRAHPEHYIPKLPATEESFRLMIETPPQAKPPQLPAAPSTSSSGENAPASNGIPTITTQAFGSTHDPHMMEYTQTGPARTLEDQHPMAATAAVALAQLHNQRAGSEWSHDRLGGPAGVGNGHARDRAQGYVSDFDSNKGRPHSSYELPPIQDHRGFPTSQPRGLLPSMLDHSPPGRSTTLPPIQDGTRPRNRSIGEQARVTKHQRKLSKGYARRMSLEGRKAYSVEPPGSDAFIAKTKRWEDLIEAATSIRGDESDRDLTPIPGSPLQRSSVPPLHVPSSVQRNDVYKASPLGRALTPPTGLDHHPASSSSNVPFPSIESSANSYPSHAHSHSQSSFQMPSTASSYPSDSSPQFTARHLLEIYCANCRRVNPLKDSFACVECISGFCVDCVCTLSGVVPAADGRGVRGIGGRAQQPCPKCRGEGGVYRPFQLELRV